MCRHRFSDQVRQIRFSRGTNRISVNWRKSLLIVSHVGNSEDIISNLGPVSRNQESRLSLDISLIPAMFSLDSLSQKQRHISGFQLICVFHDTRRAFQESHYVCPRKFKSCLVFVLCLCCLVASCFIL